ncbi:hypothetical protein BTUL_0184g00280 [Botrytis tulipae]|uniref:Uncharacterized protein n=1 Tax=Botrytis tulipae TaxID=87230 RepID=A0A4Z1EHZ4_9HELO|nr:hypothetical protein BTUL_0184g00280 [Botrytis tulipae]
MEIRSIGVADGLVRKIGGGLIDVDPVTTNGQEGVKLWTSKAESNFICRATQGQRIEVATKRIEYDRIGQAILRIALTKYLFAYNTEH